MSGTLTVIHSPMVIKSFVKVRGITPLLFLPNPPIMKTTTTTFHPTELTEEIYEEILKDYKESGLEQYDEMFLILFGGI